MRPRRPFCQHSAWLFAFGAVVGCRAAAPADDVAVYTTLLAGGSAQAMSDLPACATLADPDLAGDCALVLTGRILDERTGDAEELCPQVPAGVWRDECWFQEAERRRARGQDQSAARLCLKAGRFRDDCAQHLWQTAVHNLIAQAGPAAFAERLPRGQAIYDEWAPHLASGTDFEDRFWEKYYQNGFEGQGGVDLEHCMPLPEAHQARCRAAGAAYFSRELAPRVDQAGASAAFCALDSPDAAAVGAWFPNRAEPLLDEVVVRRHQEVCGEAAEGRVSGGDDPAPG